MKKIEDRLSEAKEDYLETILMLSQNGDSVHLVDIAKSHKVSKATVSNALVKLGESGFVVYEKYRPVSLTEKGRILAKNTLKKHKMLIDFLTENLGVPMDEAREAACKMEHAIGAKIANKLAEFMAKLDKCGCCTAKKSGIRPRSRTGSSKKKP